MKRPAFQFYPADWRNNAKLRRCSWAARGAWIDVLGLLHDSDEYGVLRWPLKEIAQAVGCPLALVKELADKGVLKGCDTGRCTALRYAPMHAGRRGPEVVLVAEQSGPVWYSSRFVRDEFIRLARGAGTRFGESPDPPPKGGIGEAPKPPPSRRQGDGASSTSTSTPSDERVVQNPHDIARATGAELHRLPRGMMLTDEWRAFAKAERSSWNDDRIQRVFLDFRDHYAGSPTVREDWTPLWQKWVRGQHDEPVGKTATDAGPAWWATDGATLKEGERLGLKPRPGESMSQFRDRIREAQAKAAA